MAITFLDLTFSITDNQLCFDIFRKPTFTDTVVPSDSNHPTNIKFFAFYSLINRLLRLPLSKELSAIYSVEINNGYGTSMVDKNIHKIK